MADKIRLLIVDDHAILREGMRAFISTLEEIELVGEAGDGDAAVSQARLLQPDVILMDLVMPGKNGIEAIREITAENPAACILVLTSFTEDDKVSQAIAAGAMGYLLKDSDSRQLLQAIQTVHRGEIAIQPRVMHTLVKGMRSPVPQAVEPLTEREEEVLGLIAEGLSNLEIARRLGLSEWTVRTHVRNLLGKLHLENRTQAALYAVKEGKK
jgi:two-component system, NarL family, response regulator LiaR